MEQNLLVAVALLAIVVLALAFWLAMRRRHTRHLRNRFGAEYDHAVEATGNRAKAETALAEREKRVSTLEIRPMSASERQDFSQEWREVKAVFVDSPTEAVLHADRMLASMMKAIGYPMADFNRRYEDLTVNHAEVATHYRQGREIVERHGSGSASTEDMRQAMKHYETVFDCLVADADGDEAEAASARRVRAETDRVRDPDFRGDEQSYTTRG